MSISDEFAKDWKTRDTVETLEGQIGAIRDSIARNLKFEG
jgi:hypothetical protein